jgi:hypothetical protein
VNTKIGAAVELFKGDGTPAGIFHCSVCRIVYASKAQADNCHGERICSCGNSITMRYNTTCSDCMSKKWRADAEAREAERFEKAKKISELQYDGAMVYLDDKFYTEVADAIDQYLEGHEPEYVWACEDVGVPTVNMDDFTDRILEGMWEDASLGDLNGIEELDTAIREFNKANESVPFYQVDYSTAILVSGRYKTGGPS